MNDDALSQILTALRMRGSVYFLTSFSPPWGVHVPQHRQVARFHMAIRGQCWLRVEGHAPAISLAAGDLVVIPHGAAHILSDAPDRPPTKLDDVLAQTGYNGSGALVYGGPNDSQPCQLFCGHFEFDDAVLHPLLRDLPRCIHIPNTESMNSAWLESVMRFVGAEVFAAKPGADAIVHRLSEIIFIQSVRAFVEQAGPHAGCLAGVTDAQLSRALSQMHKAPGKGWTVESLAQAAGLSRTIFAERFSRLMGMTPLGYLTQWRMNLAHGLLREGGKPLIEIAETVGYHSESAFARAFRRHFGASPGGLRHQPETRNGSGVRAQNRGRADLTA